mmetsp:Transcript_28081/g.59283  ORF Transcript_28081/g.59283 Transcript_28081/m.59283 type:complete len:422 (-) Transcript_28081:15-1280(-)
MLSLTNYNIIKTMRSCHFVLASTTAFVRPSSRHISSSLSSLWNPSSLSANDVGQSVIICRRHHHCQSTATRHRHRQSIRDVRQRCNKKSALGCSSSSQLHFSSFDDWPGQGSSMSSNQRWYPRRHHSSNSFTPTRSTFSSTRSSFSTISHRKSNHVLKHNTQSTRLFGSKPGSPNAKPGAILLEDDREQSQTIPINLPALHRTVETIRDIIGYPTYDVSLTLVDDDTMTEINRDTRGIPAPTDVLSFCFQDKFLEPGVLGPVDFDLADYYNLGDMLIDVDYVARRCEEDRKRHEEEGIGGQEDGDGGLIEGQVLSEKVDSDDTTEGDDEEDGYEYEYMEVEVDEYDDRGVAPAMQYIYDPEIRIHMLVVHGMLHLVGYDHIEDDDYELMVVREDEVLAELRKRLGDNFGVKEALSAGGQKG